MPPPAVIRVILPSSTGNPNVVDRVLIPIQLPVNRDVGSLE